MEHGMGDDRKELNQQLRFLQGLLAGHATIAGDVVAVGGHTWAIYGSIPVDGDVIMAEFSDRAEAEAVLGQVSTAYRAGLDHDDAVPSSRMRTTSDLGEWLL